MPLREHLAEMLLDVKFRGPVDRFRTKHPFSEDIAATNAVLFHRGYDRARKIRAYRKWLESNQPCVFGRVAAKNENLFICLLEEREVLAMRRGDDDLHDTIQDYRQVWKRYAFDGECSAFLIVLVSESLVEKEPGDELKEIARRLVELYMEVHPIADDSILPQHEYVFLRQQIADGKTRILKFSTLPNVFCAQGDGRWWHDHRTPGGIMVTSNPLGHFTYVRSGIPTMTDKDKIAALENAMRTIANAYPGPGRKRPRGLTHCPATRLVPRAAGEPTPLRDTSNVAAFSTDRYEGFFHTDHLIPSAFFRPERDPKELYHFDNLTFRYIYDGAADPQDHAELMTGVEASMYEARKNMDRVPDFARPDKTGKLTEKQRGQLAQWLEQNLRARLT